MSELADALRWLDATVDARLARLDELLRIESVAAQPERHAQVEAAARWLRAELTRIGLADARILATPGQPSVTAAWTGAPPRAPSVLAYAHFDVQPPEPLDAWTTPPFEPSIRGGRLYARGASDDKGQLMMHLAAAEAFLATSGRLPVDLRFLFEGEEELGSPHLEALLDEHRDLLSADLAVVTDGSMFDAGVPAIGYGVRGLVYLEVVVRGPASDLHSGGYGGAVPNPANALAAMLASLHDADGRVAVPGFYEDVQPVSVAERAALARLPFDEPRFRATVGASALAGEPGYTVLERLWIRPTLDVNGLVAGWTGEGSKTVIPARAVAKLSCRLVPDQDPATIARLVEAALRTAAPPGIELEVQILGLAPPAVVDLDHPAVAAAAGALEAAFGRAPVRQRAGSTIPAVGYLARTLGLPTIIVGFGLPDAHAHAPDEWLDLDAYARGSAAIARLWASLGAR